MKYSPEQKNSRTVHTIIAMAFLLGGITYAVPIICTAKGISYAMPWLFSLLTLLSAAAALYFLVRYKMTGFTYILRPRSDIDVDPELEAAFASPSVLSRFPADMTDFIVMKSQGSRTPVMECVMSMGDLVEIIPISKKGTDQLTHSDVTKKYRAHAVSDFVFYDYTLSFRWQNALELVFIDGQRYVGIIIETDEVFEGTVRSIKK